jgi:hypothetical protein
MSCRPITVCFCNCITETSHVTDGRLLVSPDMYHAQGYSTSSTESD